MNRGLKCSLKQWVGKVFRSDNKSKKFMNDVARRITTCDMRESKHQLEEIIANDLYLRIEELKAKDAPAADALALLDEFTKEHDLNGTHKMSNFITEQVERYFTLEEGRNVLDFIPNAIHPDTKTFDCICPKTTRDLQVSERTQRCYRCDQEHHTNCMWGPEEGDYQCPLCFVQWCLPNRRTEQVLFGGYLRQTKKDKIEYIINLPLSEDILNNFAVEARCVRLNKDNRYELTWPENCYVMLNHRKIMDFKPLPATSSLKRRVDQEIVLDSKILSKDNILVIEEKHQYIEGARTNNYSHHFVVLVAVTPLSASLTQETYSQSHLSLEASKMRLREYLDRGFADCYIDKLKVPLQCHFYTNKITIPVRSRHCRSHYQPFDLRGFIYANISSKYSAQRWKCPICKRRAYDLQIDQYLLSIITQEPSLTEIIFNRQGELELATELRHDKDQPSLTTSSSVDHQIELKYPRQINIKREHKAQLDSSSCQEIPLEEESDKSKIEFKEIIELLDSDSEPVPKPKRSYRFRSVDRSFQEAPPRPVRKRNKKELPGSIVEESDSVQPIESKDFENNPQSDRQEEVQSPFSEEQFKAKLPKKKRSKRHYHRERVGIEEPPRMIDKMAKTLVPSPSIRTVIPEAIRISDLKVAEPRKAQPQPIDIADSEDDAPEVVRFKKLQYNLNELQREKGTGMNRQLHHRENTIFLSICQNFVLSMQRA